jgi:predicted glycosyltransferase involved in capsule biosynthesis
LNVGGRHLANGNLLILLDADVLLTEEWFEELEGHKGPAIAWGKLYYLSEEATSDYLMVRRINFDLAPLRIVKPKVSGNAGGVVLVERDVFFKIGGVPEDFGSSWGGPDNFFMIKLLSYGYQREHFNSTIYHMHHDISNRTFNTDKFKEISPGVYVQETEMKWWRPDDWRLHTKRWHDWGNYLQPGKPDESTQKDQETN